jgi:hypothetical protein
MASRTAGPEITDPDATEFVRFCYRRRRVGWPELYDEMCAVAARGAFRGMGPDELGGLGIGFSLFDMPALAVLSTRVIAEEQAKRRPVAVAIVAEPVAFEIEGAAASDPGEAPAVTDPPVPAEIPVAAETAAVNAPIERSTERAEIDVAILLSPVTAGA